jgi:tetratricopeptide (TPR) repeat protein
MAWIKKLLFGIAFSFLLLFFVFGGAELVLRLVGFGHSPKFWRREKDEQGRVWIRDNAWVTAPFFSRELIRRPVAFRLPEKKGERTYRVFVLGSSAAMGDPESSFSIARVLDVLLSNAYPEIHFEVVNAGITAINSHVVRGIASDCAELQPDLFFVYEGNNEVIVPYGPGTVFTPFLRSPGAIRAAVFLRGLRIGQALTELAHRENHSKANGLPEEWGGMKMFLEHAIGPDDPRLVTTADLFKDNLRAIVHAGVKAGATVVLGNVLTNERDFAPFQSRHAPGVSADALHTWETDVAAGRAALNTGDWYEAERQFRAALAIDGEFAETHFHLARSLLGQGDSKGSKPEFQRALDDDWLRFRTDSRLNAAIRAVANENGAESHKGRVIFDDLVGAAEGQARDGLIGDDLLYEHVHLNFRGTYLVAHDLFRIVSDDLKRKQLIKDAVAEPVDADVARSQLAFTIYDQAMITKQLLGRFEGAPFNAQSSNPERIALFRQRDARAAQLLALPQSASSILQVYDQALASRPNDWVLQRNAGMALLAFKHADRAKTKLDQALAMIPDDPDALYASAIADRQAGDASGAKTRLEKLKAVAPRYPGIENLER